MGASFFTQPSVQRGIGTESYDGVREPLRRVRDHRSLPVLQLHTFGTNTGGDHGEARRKRLSHFSLYAGPESEGCDPNTVRVKVRGDLRHPPCNHDALASQLHDLLWWPVAHDRYMNIRKRPFHQGEDVAAEELHGVHVRRVHES